MPKLALSVRIAAGSILLLSVAHILFWFTLAIDARSDVTGSYPYNLLSPVAFAFSAAGLFGVAVAIGIFFARNWARIGALVIAGLVAVFCAFGVLALVMLSFGVLSLGLGVEIPQKSDLARSVIVYSLSFALALWWIFLFSRKSVAAQFWGSQPIDASAASSTKSTCPPPIALLAWLMIVSAALSAISWPIIFGRIPAMLFARVYPIQTSKWIWAANIFLFLLCGVGLLRLYRWSYDATIVLHVFWTVSLFFSQLSPNYPGYIRECLLALEFPSTINDPTAFVFPYWLTAILSVVPTFLLVVGLFYYRRGFLQAVEDSRRPLR